MSNILQPEDIRRASRKRLALETEIAATQIQDTWGMPRIIRAVDPPSSVEECLGRALAVAQGEWKLDVEEPDGHNWERIDGYVRGKFGLKWTSADKDNLSSPIPYTRNGQFYWCGAFAAWGHGCAGLDPRVRKYLLASTLRINAACNGKSHSKNMQTAIKLYPVRRLSWKQLLPGDIACFGEEGSKEGDHVVLIEKIEGDTAHTIEGNAHGTGPDGEYREGVIKHQRPKTANRKAEYRFIYGVRWDVIEAYSFSRA